MLKQMVYMCEECGYRSTNKQEIASCEQRHKELNNIIRCTDFEITENHLKLIKNQNVKYNNHTEYGATEIDPKRPYGNSWVEGDIGSILHIKMLGEEDGDSCYTMGQEHDFWLLHVETMIALQICMSLLTFDVGKYHRDDWICGKWIKV